MQGKQTNKNLYGVIGEQSRQPGLEGLRSKRKNIIEMNPTFMAAFTPRNMAHR